MDPDKQTVYHYCSVEAFLGIVTSKVLWLNDSYKMNDSLDCRWALEVLNKIVQSNSSINSRDKEEIFKGYELNSKPVYLFSMSYEPDILSQWRAYAQGGEGVSIGFDRSLFPKQDHFPGTNISSSLNDSLWEVIYEIEEQTKLVQNLLVAQLLNPHGGNRDGSVNYGLIGALFTGLCPILKNPAFKEEKEVRLVHCPLLLTDVTNLAVEKVGSEYALKQRATDGRIVTFFEYPFPKGKFIKEIWLGPRSKLSEKDIIEAFAINGLGSVTVKKSAATLTN